MTSLRRIMEEVAPLLRPASSRFVHFSLGTLTDREISEFKARLDDPGFPLADGPAVPELHATAAKVLEARTARSFASARQAWWAILKALEVGPGDEVLLPAYTCVVVPAAVVYLGATPVWCDIDPRTFGPDPADVRARVTDRTKVVLAQHTYGYPSDVPALLDIARPRGIALVEDCTHTFAAHDGGRVLGSQGDAAFYSFEVTKPLSTGHGGLAVTSRQDLGERLASLWEATPTPDADAVRQEGRQLLSYARWFHPERHLHGRFVLAALHKSGRFAPSITAAERAGARPEAYPRRMSNLHASLALSQIAKAADVNAHRIDVARRWAEGFRDAGYDAVLPPDRVPLLRWPFYVEDRERLRRALLRQQVDLGMWFNAPLHPAGSDSAAFGYRDGDRPVGEAAARHTASLPTHPAVTEADVQRVLGLLRRHLPASEVLPAPPEPR